LVSELAALPNELMAGLWSALQEPRIWFVLAISLIGGVVRGYSGFGGALIVIPLAAMAMGPTIAVPMFYLFDLGSATPYGYRSLPTCKWSEILPMLTGHLLMLPVGAWMLTSLDSTSVRWGMEACVISMLALLISGWRYTGRPTPSASVGVGAFAGVLGSATGISGPPIIAYWLGQKENAAAIRNNIMAYYALSSTATDVLFLWRGLFTWQVVIYAIIIWPAYAGGLWGGAKMFKYSSDRMFRVSAYVLIAISAVLSLPLLDRFLK
jgi:uncharacterized membrane protein YfcA